MKDDKPKLFLIREKVCPKCGGVTFKLYGFSNNPRKIMFVCEKCKIGMELEVLKLGLPGEFREYEIDKKTS